MNYNASNNDFRLRKKKPHWEIPEILSVLCTYVRYQEPKLRFINGLVVKKSQAVEIVIQTKKELPVRAISPALFIGSKTVDDYQKIGQNKYKFHAFDFQDLQKGMPIYAGWPGFPKTRIKTRFLFTFEKPGLV